MRALGFTAMAFCLLAFLLVFPSNVAAEVERPVFGITSKDGKSTLELHLVVQFRWEYRYLDQGPNRGWTSENRILFRRIRPVVLGSLLTEDLTYLLQVNLVPGALELLDLWFNYRLHSKLGFQVGQAKIPFTRYRLNSFQDRPLVDWSYATRYFGAERQIGVMLHNGVNRPPPLEYQLGIYTGVNARASDGIGMSQVYAEPLSNPSSMTAATPLRNLHTEIVAHAAYNHGGINVRRPSDLEGGPPRFSAGLSVAWDLQPTPRQDLRLRVAPEAELKAYGFALCGVFYLGLWDQLTGSNRYQPGLVGGLLQMSYVFLERYEIALRYTGVHILDDLRNDARSYADHQIAAEEDPNAAEELALRYADVGRLQTEHEINLGFNLYLFGTTLKWQVDTGLLIHERVDDNRCDLQLRTQFQLAF